MKTFSTFILAVCPITGDTLKFLPDIYIKAIDENSALQYCQENGLGYLHIHGEFVESIPCESEVLNEICLN